MLFVWCMVFACGCVWLGVVGGLGLLICFAVVGLGCMWGGVNSVG